MKTLIAVAAFALIAGCTARHQPPPAPTVAEQFAESVARARAAAAEGRRAEADAILAGFVQANGSTPEAKEAAYWRAIFRLETASTQADRDEAKRSLDAYLADTTPAAHLSEARIIRQLLTAVDSITQATDSVTAAARQATSVREEELRKEIQSLKEQLDKTNEELTRIKRRLGARP